ncbi:MAG: signal peptidase II [Nanoarchaeota archaeon]|nr:signal peptidase II [Nanoarchaeota archaeon]
MKKLRIPLTLILLIVIDQLTKLFFTTTRNYGAAFGILQGKNTLFILISILVILLAFTQLKHQKYSFPLILLIAGSFSNLIDRLFLGYVRDFISLPLLSFWPSFNIADCFLTIGFFWLITKIIKLQTKK